MHALALATHDRVEELVRHSGAGFLPFTLARELRAFLVDGRLDVEEAQRFLDLVEAHPAVEPAQRRALEGVVRRWTREDARVLA